MLRIILAIAMLSLYLASCSTQKNTYIPDGEYVTSLRNMEAVDTSGNIMALQIDGADKVFYLLRHAEKDTFPQGNPQLTEEGLARANYLAEMMKGVRLDAIYSTLYTRTLFTVDTLASRKGLKIRPYEASGMKDLYEGIVADSSLQRVLIVGHSNTTPAFANTILGYQEYDSGFDLSDYDNLLIVAYHADSTNVIHKLKFRPR